MGGLETGGACVLFVLVLTRYNREEGFVNRCWIIVWKLGIKWRRSYQGYIEAICASSAPTLREEEVQIFLVSGKIRCIYLLCRYILTRAINNGKELCM